jgi:hypothetical protein
MQVVHTQQHKICIKEYVDADRHVVQCMVCGIEVGFNPEERPGRDGAESLFKKLPCISREREARRIA